MSGRDSFHFHKWRDVARNPDWTLKIGFITLTYDGRMKQRCSICGETRQVVK